MKIAGYGSGTLYIPITLRSDYQLSHPYQLRMSNTRSCSNHSSHTQFHCTRLPLTGMLPTAAMHVRLSLTYSHWNFFIFVRGQGFFFYHTNPYPFVAVKAVYRGGDREALMIASTTLPRVSIDTRNAISSSFRLYRTQNTKNRVSTPDVQDVDSMLAHIRLISCCRPIKPRDKQQQITATSLLVDVQREQNFSPF